MASQKRTNLKVGPKQIKSMTVASKPKRRCSHFENDIALKLVAAQDDMLTKMMEANSAATLKNALNGSRRYLALQSVIFKEVSLLGDYMCKELSRHDVSHSPIKASDFRSAKLAIEEFAETAQKVYGKTVKNGVVFGGSAPELDAVKLNAVILTAKHRIDGEEKVYLSKTSMWKWMWHDARTKIWSMFLILIGGSLMAIFKYLWPQVKKLIDTIPIG